jgi:hypothetical protein
VLPPQPWPPAGTQPRPGSAPTCRVDTVSEQLKMAPSAMQLCSSVLRSSLLLAARTPRSAREAPKPITAASTSVPTTPNMKMVRKFCMGGPASGVVRGWGVIQGWGPWVRLVRCASAGALC